MNLGHIAWIEINREVTMTSRLGPIAQNIHLKFQIIKLPEIYPENFSYFPTLDTSQEKV